MMSDKKNAGQLFYHRLPEFDRKEEKLDFLAYHSLDSVPWRHLRPSARHTWLRSDTDDEFETHTPIGSKDAKRVKNTNPETIFKTYARGVQTGRDAYAYDFVFNQVATRMRQFVKDYNAQVAEYQMLDTAAEVDSFVDYSKIKWGSFLKQSLRRGNYAVYNIAKIRNGIYRPFTKKYLYFDRIMNEAVILQPYFFPNEQSESENVMIWYKVGVDWPQYALMVNRIPDLMPRSGSQCFPFYTYDPDGSNRRDNITDWALAQFRDHYADPAISKWDIFYYVYALLQHPGYRQRYALDLKRSLPRIPFAPASADLPPKALGGPRGVTFHAYARAGRQLADLHLTYESAQRYPLEWQTRGRPDYRVEKMRPINKRDAETGGYKVFDALKYNDSLTLRGIPERAFAYRLGNRAALDWIVDQYRVKTDKRSGITHDPNGYSDDAQYVLKLVERVITVSLWTVDIVEGLAGMDFR